MLATTSTSLAPRIAVDNCLLIELLQSIYYALFNGWHECALVALDSVHQRARYELMPDVLLVSARARASAHTRVHRLRTQ
jgi:hypothetical protein